jgi:ABC-2 type transport system permease protein
MLKFLIEKEFRQILRHPFIPKIIIGMPVVMLLVLPWAANQDIRNMNLSVVDSDRSALSVRLIHKLASSGYFRLTGIAASGGEALQSVDAGIADAVVEIPSGFSRELTTAGTARVMISVNSVNGAKGGLGSQYLTGIVGDYARELTAESSPASAVRIDIPVTARFNPHMDYKVFIIPALMVMLLTLLTGFLPALNIVSEKETGTIEQINVTPVRNITFIFAKLIPYWIIGYVVMATVMTLAALVYGLHPAGSPATVFLYATVYILVVSGLGLVVSNYSSTMQQAMFVMFFFMLIIVLMSGLFTPVASMPDWAQAVTLANPLKYFMEVMRAVYLKGASMPELMPQFFALCGFAVFFNGWAVLSYRKRG